MSQLTENTRFLTNLQQQILTNLQEGKPAHEGITRENLQKGIQLLRQDRTRATTEKASATRKAKTSAPAVDLKDLVNSFQVPGKE